MRQLPSTIPRIALLVAAAALALPASFALPISAARAAEPAPGLAISHASDYVTPGGTLDVSAEVRLPQPSAVTTVRFRVMTAKNKVLYQHTESLYGLPAGTHLVRFERRASAMGLKEGVYRLTIHVEATGAEPADIAEPLVVVSEKRKPIPVAVVIRVRGVPLIGADGVPVSDPATSSAIASRDEAIAAARLHEVRPDIPFTLAVPPFMLDDWRRVAQGYRMGEDETPVSLEETVPAEFREASHILAAAAKAGLTFAGMPYAEPDIGGLDSIDALDDLTSQIRYGSRVASSTVHTATPGAVLDGGPLRARTADIVAAEGAGWALLAPAAAARSDGTTPTTGAYPIEGVALTALVIDERASDLLGDPTSSRTELLEHLYRLSNADKGVGRPVIAVVEVGDEATATVADLQARLAALGRVKWVRLVTLPQAAESAGAGPLRLGDAGGSMDADDGAYWARLARARERAQALHAAADPGDADADECVRGITLAEHRLWRSRLREAGAARVHAADQLAMSFLEGLTLTAPNVTLSGTRGKVRASVTNPSDKVLTLIVESAPHDLRVLQDQRVAISAPPGETLLSIPVEARGSLAGTLRLRLFADRIQVAAATSTVRAGFLDRLVIVAGVAVILLGLLWYIRSRGRSAFASAKDAFSAPDREHERPPEESPSEESS